MDGRILGQRRIPIKRMPRDKTSEDRGRSSPIVSGRGVLVTTPERFGSYLLLKKIGRGSMAELFFRDIHTKPPPDSRGWSALGK
jgi:hypothetical protein